MHKLGYIPGSSLIHKMYPITKFIWLLIGSIIIFAINRSILVMTTALLFLVVLLLIHPTIWNTRGFKLVINTGLILVLLYLLSEKSGQTLLFFQAPPLLQITSGGLELGLRTGGRFLSIIFLSYIVILTTQPNHLAYSLMQLGIPYRYGFMLVTALRLAPILEEEGKTIYQAQLVRGVKYDQKNIKKILLLIKQFMTPLLFSALRKADKLVFSMEGRGFGKSPKRTFYNQTTHSYLDFLVSLGLLIFYITLLILEFGVTV